MRNKFSGKKDTFIFFLLLFPHIKPGFISTIDWLDIVFNIGRIISAFVILLLYIKQNQISKFIITVILFKLVLLLPTLYYNGELSVWVITSLSLIVVCMLFEIYFKKDITTLLNGTTILFELLIYANLIIMLLFPEGIAERRIGVSYLFGGANVAIRYILPGIAASLIRSFYLYRRITLRSILLVVASFTTVFISWSVTAMVGFSVVVLYTLLLLLFYKKRFPIPVNFTTAFVSSLTFFYLIIIVRIQDFFSVIITNVFNKDLTFTGRTYLWDNAIYYISKSPLWGWGIEDKNVVWDKIGNPNGAHNYYLDLLYRGGMLQLVVFLIILIFIAKKLIKYKKSKFTQILTVIFISYFIMWLFEPFYNEEPMTFIVFLFAFYIDKLISQYNKLWENNNIY